MRTLRPGLTIPQEMTSALVSPDPPPQTKATEGKNKQWWTTARTLSPGFSILQQMTPALVRPDAPPQKATNVTISHHITADNKKEHKPQEGRGQSPIMLNARTFGTTQFSEGRTTMVDNGAHTEARTLHNSTNDPCSRESRTPPQTNHLR